MFYIEAFSTRPGAGASCLEIMAWLCVLKKERLWKARQALKMRHHCAIGGKIDEQSFTNLMCGS